MKNFQVSDIGLGGIKYAGITLLIASVFFVFISIFFKDENGVATMSSDQSLSFLEKGDYYFNQGAYADGTYRLGRAMSYYKTAINHNESSVHAQYQLGRIHFLRGDYDAALENFRYLEGQYPDEVPHNIYYMKGLAYGYRAMETGVAQDWYEAENSFLTFLQVEPTSVWGAVDLAWVYFSLGDFDRMLSVTEQAMGHSADNAWLLNMYGLALMNNEQYLRSVEVLTEASAKANTLTSNDWADAYPGHNPSLRSQELRAFVELVEFNLARAHVRNDHASAQVVFADEPKIVRYISPQGLGGGVAMPACGASPPPPPPPPPPTVGHWNTSGWSGCSAPPPSWRPWGSWSSWSTCSASCDGGTQSRSRTRSCQNTSGTQTRSVTCNYDICVGHRPSHIRGCTRSCSGSNRQTQTRSCNREACPPSIDIWAELSGSSNQHTGTVQFTPANVVDVHWRVVPTRPGHTVSCSTTNLEGATITNSNLTSSQNIPMSRFTLDQTRTSSLTCSSSNSHGSAGNRSNSIRLRVPTPDFDSFIHNPAIVRAGDTTDIEWNFDPNATGVVSVGSSAILDYELDCSIRGAVTEDFTIPAEKEYEDSVISNPLFNTFDTRIGCNVTTGGVQNNAASPIESIHRVEVVPAPQED